MLMNCPIDHDDSKEVEAESVGVPVKIDPLKKKLVKSKGYQSKIPLQECVRNHVRLSCAKHQINIRHKAAIGANASGVCTPCKSDTQNNSREKYTSRQSKKLKQKCSDIVMIQALEDAHQQLSATNLLLR